jgi:uncharacterized protein (TIGR02145 family)
MIIKVLNQSIIFIHKDFRLKNLLHEIMKNKIKIVISICTLILLLAACKDKNSETETPYIPRSLIELKIGTQIWSANNLDVSTFRNGDAIFEAKTIEEWMKAGNSGSPAWCYNNNDPANGQKYGKLYNWFAVQDPRKLAPLGWHIPNITEWLTLTEYLENNGYGYNEKVKIAKSMAAASGWKVSTGIGAVGNDQKTNNRSGFTALPGGCRLDNGQFYKIDNSAYWWSSSLWGSGTDDARGVSLASYDTNLTRFYNNKIFGFSVRCLKD